MVKIVALSDHYERITGLSADLRCTSATELFVKAGSSKITMILAAVKLTWRFLCWLIT